MQTKLKLTDILRNGQRDTIADAWDTTQAAGDFEPLPAGTYIAHLHAVELFKARTQTPGVQMRFKVVEGEHAGRMVFHDCWLTPAALPQTKRDLGKLGMTRLEQLENPTVQPGRIRCKLRVSLRSDDSGEQRNRVRSFEVVSIDTPEPDAFAPAPLADGSSNPPVDPPSVGTDSPADDSDPGEPDKPADADPSFNFGVNGADAADSDLRCFGAEGGA